VNNKLVIGTIVGQTIITLTAIGYGFSAHSSWEMERHRRIAGERAAVSEMATAMKGAGDRLVTMEKELARCQVRARRAARPAAEAPAAAPAAAASETTPQVASPPEPSTEEALQVLASPMTWTPQTRGESASPITTLPSSWCAGRYERASGNNFGPCAPSRP
jgi:hypothetical protein